MDFVSSKLLFAGRESETGILDTGIGYQIEDTGENGIQSIRHRVVDGPVLRVLEKEAVFSFYGVTVSDPAAQ